MEDMELFEYPDKTRNLLPCDGEVYYYGTVFDRTEADRYLGELLRTIAWKNDEAVLFGRRIVTKRKVAWYGSRPFEYTYSNSTKTAVPWTDTLLELKAI